MAFTNADYTKWEGGTEDVPVISEKTDLPIPKLENGVVIYPPRTVDTEQVVPRHDGGGASEAVGGHLPGNDNHGTDGTASHHSHEDGGAAIENLPADTSDENVQNDGATKMESASEVS